MSARTIALTLSILQIACAPMVLRRSEAPELRLQVGVTTSDDVAEALGLPWTVEEKDELVYWSYRDGSARTAIILEWAGDLQYDVYGPPVEIKLSSKTVDETAPPPSHIYIFDSDAVLVAIEPQR